ncbi:hypothetical protein G7046_g1056 [Stylonectria norvegica]|nr:hypothetical protein G7046_g1056 [Stylonectria norvegica]
MQYQRRKFEARGEDKTQRPDAGVWLLPAVILVGEGGVNSLIGGLSCEPVQRLPVVHGSPVIHLALIASEERQHRPDRADPLRRRFFAVLKSGPAGQCRLVMGRPTGNMTWRTAALTHSCRARSTAAPVMMPPVERPSAEEQWRNICDSRLSRFSGHAGPLKTVGMSVQALTDCDYASVESAVVKIVPNMLLQSSYPSRRTANGARLIPRCLSRVVRTAVTQSLREPKTHLALSGKDPSLLCLILFCDSFDAAATNAHRADICRASKHPPVGVAPKLERHPKSAEAQKHGLQGSQSPKEEDLIVGLPLAALDVLHNGSYLTCDRHSF